MHADINECTAGTHQCEQVCQNTVGSYTCACNSGFVLDSDGRSCDGISIAIEQSTAKMSNDHKIINIQMLWNAQMEPIHVSKCVLTHMEPIDVHATMVSHSMEMDLPAVVSIILIWMYTLNHLIIIIVS